MPFTVLVVCTGNIARSPMTQLLLQSWSDPRAQLAVSSAGTHAMDGYPMDRGAASAMGQLGIDPSKHRARQFEPAMAAAADLILTAERAHLDTVLAEVPTAMRRAFTIKEFARLAPHLHPGSPPEVVAEAAAIRGLVPRPADPAEDDVADPHRQPTSVNKGTAEELTVAVREILEALGLAPPRPQADRPPAVPAPSRPRPRPRPSPR